MTESSLRTNAGARSRRATLRMWQLFVTAVECGSLLKTADLSGADVAHISRELKTLESLMQEPLLERNRSGVKPTWAGIQRYREAKEVLAEHRRLTTFRTASNDVGNTLRIGVPESLAPLFLRWVSEFRTKEPEGGAAEVVQYPDGTVPETLGFDCFVCTDSLPEARVTAVSLGFVKRVIVASPAFLRTEPKLSVPEELSARRLIAEKSGRMLMFGPKQSVAISVNPVLQVNSVQGLTAPALAGVGYAVGVPFWLVENDISEGRLNQVLPQWYAAPRPVWVLRRAEKKSNRLAERLMKFFAKCWRQTPALSSGWPAVGRNG